MCENIQNCCRICLDEESDHISILGDSTIQLQIKSCLAISISADDHLPTNICASCVAQLSDFYNFQLNARCSQDWLESCIEEQTKKSTEKIPLQPLPDSEYNSDSLLEFLNNTANIEEYLNNLGKEDIPAIVNMLDKNQENFLDISTKFTNNMKCAKVPTPKKKDAKTKSCIKMEIDVLDSDVDIVKELIEKGIEPKKPNQVKEKMSYNCFACKAKFDTVYVMSQHTSVCENAPQTCPHCNLLFDSKQKMQNHSVVHSNLPFNCGKQFQVKEMLAQHHRIHHCDQTKIDIFRCKQCKATFKDRYQLYKHSKVHACKIKENICDICGQRLVGNDALIKHKKEVHEEDKDMLYRCKVCKQTSKSRKEIYLHIQNVCGSLKPDNRHLCEACGRCFSSKATLLRHVALHTTEYKCNICQKVFKEEKARDDHALAHETTICEKCGENVSAEKMEVHFCM